MSDLKNTPVTDDTIELSIPGTPLKFKGVASAMEASIKPKERVKVIPNPDNKPIRGKLDSSKAVDSALVIPEHLKGKLTAEEYALIVENNFESCEAIYHALEKQIDAPLKAISVFSEEKNKKFLPYISDVNKFRFLAKMIGNDVDALTKELNSIRTLYKDYIDAQGKTKKEINLMDVYFAEIILDIKTRYYTCQKRIQSLLEPSTLHLNDFYTAMVISYYVAHPDEAPDDVKDFIDNQLQHYIRTEMPKFEVMDEEGNPVEETEETTENQ